MRAVEFFSGIGAFGVVASEYGLDVVDAIDQDHLGNQVYRYNLGREPRPLAIESLREVPRAELWWMSPPCTPYTVRGERRDDSDPRARALLRLTEELERLGEAGPESVLVENVRGFAGSRSEARLCQVLTAAGRWVEKVDLDPTRFGVPMRRPRRFLVASRRGCWRPAGIETAPTPLSAFVDDREDQDLLLPERIERDYRAALDVVEPSDPEAVVATVTRAYGRSWVRSGSYLRRRDGRLRRLHPDELLRLFGFPGDWRFPPGLGLRERWRLLGNTVELRSIRWLLTSLLG